MLFQRIFALFDKIVTRVFSMSSSYFGSQDEEGYGKGCWSYFCHFGRRICIIGIDGKIHTLTGYWAVHHYVIRDSKGERLLRRIPARKDLKNGERLATGKEVVVEQTRMREEFEQRFGRGFETC